MAKGQGLDIAISQIKKMFGEGSIMRLGETLNVKVDIISTGSLTLDEATGIGGLPKGRIIEIYGPEMCLHEDTFVQYEVRTKGGKRQNHKGGTLKRLYERFYQTEADGDGRVKTQREETVDSVFSIASINDNNCVFQNQIVDVVKCGTKECFNMMLESGDNILATEDHKFFTGTKFVPLRELDSGDTVYIHNKTRNTKKNKIVVPTKVINIAPVGQHETYDVRCSSPHNNYIADNIVVHNSGKTTLALSAIASCQAEGGVGAFIDIEHALDPHYAEAIGVNTNEMLISQPDTGEQALSIAEMLVRSSSVDIIVVDSVAALVPRAEIEGEMGDTHVGLQARLMSQAMRKLAGAVHKSNTGLVFINQIRMKIVRFGNPETTSGGRALKFYASMRIDIRRIGALKRGDTVIGNKTRVKVVKNKLSAPFREAEFEIVYGKGISKAGEILDMALERGIISQKGSWFNYGEVALGQGRERAREYIEETEAMRDELLDRIRE